MTHATAMASAARYHAGYARLFNCDRFVSFNGAQLVTTVGSGTEPLNPPMGMTSCPVAMMYGDASFQDPTAGHYGAGAMGRRRAAGRVE
jgi:hypothetical protein